METKTTYRNIIYEYQSPHTPEQLWEFLVHPKYEVEFTKEPCYHNVIDDDFTLEKGKSYIEAHTGEHCKGEHNPVKIVDVEEYKYYQIVRHGAGIKDTVTTKLQANEKGTLITITSTFGLSIKSFNKPLHLMSWLLVVTGLATKLAKEQVDQAYWFEKMEEKIADMLIKNEE